MAKRKHDSSNDKSTKPCDRKTKQSSSVQIRKRKQSRSRKKIKLDEIHRSVPSIFKSSNSNASVKSSSILKTISSNSQNSSASTRSKSNDYHKELENTGFTTKDAVRMLELFIKKDNRIIKQKMKAQRDSDTEFVFFKTLYPNQDLMKQLKRRQFDPEINDLYKKYDGRFTTIDYINKFLFRFFANNKSFKIGKFGGTKHFEISFAKSNVDNTTHFEWAGKIYDVKMSYAYKNEWYRQMNDDKIKLIFLPVSLGLFQGNAGHANVLIFKKDEKKIYRFEPYGMFPNDLFVGNGLDNVLKRYFGQFVNYKYVANSSFCKIGPQAKEKQQYDEVRGYCMLFSYFLIVNILENPTKTIPSIIVKLSGYSQDDTMDKIRRFTNLIMMYHKKMIVISLKPETDSQKRFMGETVFKNNIKKMKIDNIMSSEIKKINKSTQRPKSESKVRKKNSNVRKTKSI